MTPEEDRALALLREMREQLRLRQRIQEQDKQIDRLVRNAIAEIAKLRRALDRTLIYADIDDERRDGAGDCRESMRALLYACAVLHASWASRDALLRRRRGRGTTVEAEIKWLMSVVVEDVLKTSGTPVTASNIARTEIALEGALGLGKPTGLKLKRRVAAAKKRGQRSRGSRDQRPR